MCVHGTSIKIKNFNENPDVENKLKILTQRKNTKLNPPCHTVGMHKKQTKVEYTK